MLYETRYEEQGSGSGDNLLSDYYSSPKGGKALRVSLDKVSFKSQISYSISNIVLVTNRTKTISD